MSIVTDPASNRIIFCEGKAGSIDAIFWARVLVDARHQNARYRCEIRPMGGKQAARNFAAGYTEATGNTNWLVLRDRDLDAESDGSVIRWGRQTLLTGLTCIESYFLLPDLLEQFLDAHNLAAQQTHTDHTQTLRDTLVALRDYQAARWALQTVRRQLAEQAEAQRLIRTAGVFDLPNRLTDADGKVPRQLDLVSCRNQAESLCKRFWETVQQVDVARLHERIEAYRASFDGEPFFAGDFRHWFHGKDVLHYWLSMYRNENVGFDAYCKWAACNLDWQTHFADLSEIQRLCQVEEVNG